jgi:RNA polymerase sigma-70 factor (ECF subfamily)
MTDKEFLELITKDANAAYTYLVHEYSEKVFNSIINIVRNTEDAEDLVQEVFTSIFTGIDGFKGDSKISTWIYSLTLNKSKEFLRHKTRKKRFGYLKVIDEQTENFLVECKHPGILLEDKELASILFEALDKLPENQRIAYNLSKIEGLSYSETAEFMGLSVSSVESLLFRAKKNLQENLKEYYKNQ